MPTLAPDKCPLCLNRVEPGTFVTWLAGDGRSYSVRICRDCAHGPPARPWVGLCGGLVPRQAEKKRW